MSLPENSIHCNHCSMDHSLGSQCCSTPMGPSIPNVVMTPIVKHQSFSKMQKMMLVQQQIRSKKQGYNNVGYNLGNL